MRTPARTVMAVGIAASAVLLAAGCRQGAPTVSVTSVRAAQGALAGPLVEAGLDAAALEAAARDALAGAGFRMAEGKRPHQARIDVVGIRFVPGAPGGAARVETAVELELVPAEGSEGTAVRETASGAAALSGSPGEAWRAALSVAARAAAEALALAAAEDAKPAAEVVRDLGSDDARVRRHAVRVAAERRVREAVPGLVERLRDPDPEVAHLAVGALGQLRDPRAVAPLIELSQRGDGGMALALVRIIGDVGGPEAEGYLLTLEAGHPEPRVRAAARAALADLRARAAEAARVAGK